MILPHRRKTTVSLETFPLLQMFWLWILQIQQSIRLDIARGLLMVIGIQWKTSDNGSLAHSCIL